MAEFVCLLHTFEEMGIIVRLGVHMHSSPPRTVNTSDHHHYQTSRNDGKLMRKWFFARRQRHAVYLRVYLCVRKTSSCKRCLNAFLSLCHSRDSGQQFLVTRSYLQHSGYSARPCLLLCVEVLGLRGCRCLVDFCSSIAPKALTVTTALDQSLPSSFIYQFGHLANGHFSSFFSLNPPALCLSFFLFLLQLFMHLYILLHLSHSRQEFWSSTPKQ